MLKCPFCQFDNEEGALFCEQCKSDLSGVEATPMAAPMAIEPVPVAAVLEETIPMAAPLEDLVQAAPAEATVPMAEVVEPIPLADVAPAPPAAAPPPAAAAPPPAAPAAPPPAAPAAAAAAAAAAPTAPAAGGPPAPLPAGAQPKLIVIRGQKINAEYPIYPDMNFIGRADEKPVDIDLDDQEAPERVWASRQHALITFENGLLTIEDLNSANGTYVNRTRVYPGQKRFLSSNDIIQVGTVQMKVKV